MGEARKAPSKNAVSVRAQALRVSYIIALPVSAEHRDVGEPEIASYVVQIFNIWLPDALTKHILLIPILHSAPFTRAERYGDRINSSRLLSNRCSVFAASARKEIIDAKQFATFVQQAFAKARSKKAGAPRY